MNSVFINVNEPLKNKSVLVLSDDEKLIKQIQSKEINDNYKISFFEQESTYMIADKISLYDLIVFDGRDEASIENFAKLFEDTNNFDLNIPIILLEKETSDSLVAYKNCNVYTVLCEPINTKSLINNITLCLNYLNKNKRVKLEKGYYFDLSRELFFHDKKAIKLTKTQNALLKLLISRQNQLVTYETIQKEVWKDETFSKYSLRNIVKHIRNKSSETLIKNSSNKGYVVNTY